MKKLKQILSNKNTVTFIAIILIVIIIYIFYNWRINQNVSLIRMPFASQNIDPRTKITKDMITWLEVPSMSIRGNVVSKENDLIGKYTNVNSVIPQGSLFYKSQVVQEKDLPDSFLIDIPEGYVAYNFGVNIKSTYGNSMYPNNFVDVYFKGINDEGLLMLGKLIENVRILAVKDSAGRHVFESSDADRVPSQIIFAVTKDIHLLLRKAEYIRNVEIILVPSTASINVEDSDDITINVTSETIKDYIESRSILVDETEDVTTE